MNEEIDSSLLSRQTLRSEEMADGTCCSLRHRSFPLCSKGTLFSSIFTLLTTSIGAGTLALPYAFSQGGLVYSGVVFLLVMLISVVVGFFLFSSKRYTSELFPTVEILGYEDLAEVAFGAAGRVSEWSVSSSSACNFLLVWICFNTSFLKTSLGYACWRICQLFHTDRSTATSPWVGGMTFNYSWLLFHLSVIFPVTIWLYSMVMMMMMRWWIPCYYIYVNWSCCQGW